MIDVDIKYRIPLVGEHNAGVYECPFCDHSIVDDMHQHIMGFAHTNWGVMAICECPKCFEKYYSHACASRYNLFLSYVKSGDNRFFKK